MIKKTILQLASVLSIVLMLGATNGATANTVTTTPPVYYGTDSGNPFSSAVRVGNTLYLSGALGLRDGALVEGGVGAETQQALRNINSTLLRYGYDKTNLVKCMVMLADINDFSEFNDAYLSELDAPYPVRSAFAVGGLALGASVEIECMAAK